MKILQINKYHYLRGGSERHYFELSDLLKQKGHEVLAFSMQDERNQPSSYADYFVRPVNFDKFSWPDLFKYFYNREAVKNLEKLIRKEKPDIAHLHNIAHQLGPAIIKVLKKHGIPVVQTLHDYALICPNYQLFDGSRICDRCKSGKYYNCSVKACVKNSYPKSLMATLEAYLNNRWFDYYDGVDMFIAPSDFMRQTMVGFGLAPEKIKTIYNFIDAERFSEGTADGIQQKYLLYFGRLTKEKGLDVLVEAMRNVQGYDLKIVGQGPEEQRLAELVETSGLTGRISLLGYKQNEELRQLVNGAEAVIMPSTWPENMPYSALEAMAMGKVIIASRVGGLPELIEVGKTGFLFEPGNSQELAENIAKLPEIAQDQLARFLQEKMLKLDKNNFYQQLIAIYSELLGN